MFQWSYVGGKACLHVLPPAWTVHHVNMLYHLCSISFNRYGKYNCILEAFIYLCFLSMARLTWNNWIYRNIYTSILDNQNQDRRLMIIHDEVIKWKHFLRYWSFVRGIHRSPVNSPHKGPWRWALIFSLICAWISSWADNRESGDLTRHRLIMTSL